MFSVDRLVKYAELDTDIRDLLERDGRVAVQSITWKTDADGASTVSVRIK